MKIKNRLILVLIIVLCAGFITCENPIMRTWWEDEPEYIAITKLVPQVTYETIIEHEVVYRTVFVELDPIVIVETVIEEKYVYEIIIEKVPTFDPEEVKKLPPEELIKYLTDEQIKYIVSQQPPVMIMQSIRIVDIEFILFSGDQSVYNGNTATAGGTSLTSAEKNTNDITIKNMVQALIDNPKYMLILHGHANPTTATQSEIKELMDLSIARADNVCVELNKAYGGDLKAEDRVSTSGYGGEKNLSVSSSTYAGLNRRVEMILFEIITTKTTGNVEF
jgi:hypothetical protein